MTKPRARHTKRRPRSKRQKHSAAVLLLCAAAVLFAAFLWREAYRVSTVGPLPEESSAEEEFRPQVGDPPYRVAVDAGHGGTDPGARGFVQESELTAATAAALTEWLQQDSNYCVLQTRTSYEETATPAQRAASANAQAPQLLLSIHANAAANGSTATGFECYPSVPGRTWHRESFYFAQLLADGMHRAGASLRGHGGVRYSYYLENDQKQLVETNHAEVRTERSFTVLEDVDCPAVLAEQCFVTSEADTARFGSAEGCKTVARVYYEAICSYFGTEPLPA